MINQDEIFLELHQPPQFYSISWVISDLTFNHPVSVANILHLANHYGIPLKPSGFDMEMDLSKMLVTISGTSSPISPIDSNPKDKTNNIWCFIAETLIDFEYSQLLNEYNPAGDNDLPDFFEVFSQITQFTTKITRTHNKTGKQDWYVVNTKIDYDYSTAEHVITKLM